MFVTLHPRLMPGLVVRNRSDGSVGVYDPASGRVLEVSADQATVFALVDGERSLSDLAAEHHNLHGFVPFAALKDLLAGLAAHGFLSNPPAELKANGLGAKAGWMHRLGAQTVFTLPLRLGRPVSIAMAVICVALAADSLRQEPSELDPYDVLWTLFGAALALSVRGIFKAAAASVGGMIPTRVAFGFAAGIPYLCPDGAVAALLDRWPRAVSHLFALFGAAVAVGIGTIVPGVWLGALAVLLVDLCPFAPTSMGKLLAALAGRVDLREHVRAYLSRRFLKRVTSSRFFAGERDLIISGLLSLGWISLIVRLLLTDGVVAVLSLTALGLDSEGLERALAYGGALVLTLLMPVALGVLIAAVARALLSLRPARPATFGASTGAAVKAADFSSIPLFSGLAPPELEALVQKAKELRFAPGLPIVVQGTFSDYFFAIRQGEVAVEVEEEDGLTREVTRLSAGDCFGETALLDRGVRGASVRPVTETVVAALSRADFESLGPLVARVNVKELLRATAALNKSPFFARVPPSRQSALALRLVPMQFAAGDVVVREGDSGEHFFLVAEGELDVVDAKGASINTLGPGDHFGEVALLRDVPRTATVCAKVASRVFALSKDEFIAGIAADLGLSAGLERLASERTGVKA